jgi:2-hydroxychromene-2-carboxylate isomerase
MREPIVFYFDFISPYSYLASQRIAREAAFSNLVFDYRPVVFGTILSRRGVLGPGEIPSRRSAMLADLVLLSKRLGIPFEGPPAHPFNPLYALRSAVAIESPELRGRLVQAYFRRGWAEGRSLEDVTVLKQVLSELGIAQDPEEAASASANRRALKANTEEALRLGVWGVPTFVTDGLLFFGQDRLELLADVVEGRVTLDREKLDALVARPGTISRTRGEETQDREKTG